MKKYGNDYRTSGKQFEYTGKWYGTGTSVEELKRHAVKSSVFMGIMLLVYLGGLMVNNTGSRIFWILLPYVVMIFPISYGIMGSVSLFLFCRNQEEKGKKSQVVIPEEHKGHMTRAQYEKGIRRLTRCGIAITGLSIFTVAADLILMILGGSDFLLTREILFEATALIILALGSVNTVKNWRIKAKFTIFE